MISYVKTYTKDKDYLEHKFLKQDNFKFKAVFDVESNQQQCPIKADSGGIYVEINHYQGFYSCSPKAVLYSLYENNELNGELINFNRLTFSSLQLAIDKFISLIDNPDSFKISQLTIGFKVVISKPARDFINNNIITHKSHYYTHNLKLRRDKNTKVFEYSEYEISLSSPKKKEYENIIEVSLKLKGKRILNKLGIYNLTCIKKEEVYSNLYNEFMGKVEELLIIDDFSNTENISKKDLERMKNYSSFNYWSRIRKQTTRQNIAKHRKKFLELIDKYDLNKSLKLITSNLENAFQLFITN